MTTRILPDSLKLVRNYLAGVPEIQSYVGSRVHDSLPRNPQFPAVMLRRAFGQPEWYGDDRAGIDVHCYGRSDTEASALARVVFKVLMEAPQVHAEGVLTDVKPSGDLQELDDPTYRPPQPRFIFSVTTAAHT